MRFVASSVIGLLLGCHGAFAQVQEVCRNTGFELGNAIGEAIKLEGELEDAVNSVDPSQVDGVNRVLFKATRLREASNRMLRLNDVKVRLPCPHESYGELKAMGEQKNKYGATIQANFGQKLRKLEGR